MVLGAVKGRAQARAASGFIPLTAPARHDRGMLVGTKGVPTVSTTPPAGRTKGCQKKPHEVLARFEKWPVTW